MKVTESDKKMLKALMYILNNGSFSLKWREATAFGLSYKWLEDLDKRFNKKDKEIEIKEPEDVDSE